MHVTKIGLVIHPYKTFAYSRQYSDVHKYQTAYVTSSCQSKRLVSLLIGLSYIRLCSTKCVNDLI